MSYGRGRVNGRVVGYTVETLCEQDGCEKLIDRGMSYLCGDRGLPSEADEHGCGGFFCWDHLFVTPVGSLCGECAAAHAVEEESGGRGSGGE